MRKTDILDVVARKLSPYMFLFGVYLVSFGDSSPGGGFQGGVVIASGIILLAMARGPRRAEELFPAHRLAGVETTAFIALLLVGTAGIALSGAFLAGFLGGSGVRFVFLLNILIGLKVAAGVSLISLTIFREE
ncbi:MAG: MnhB domain-containing protein [Alkalispirochaeta sp.]